MKQRIVSRIRSADRLLTRLKAIAMLALVMPGSRFLVLWSVDVVFGDAVRLSGFFSVTGLIIVLMLARGGVRAVLEPRAAVPGDR